MAYPAAPLASLANLSLDSSATSSPSSSAPAISPTPSRTPGSYLQLDFALPRKRYVGMLACQRDPLLRTLETEVVRCDKAVPAAPTGGKAGKKDKAAKKGEEKKDEWEVELLDTVLFPEGGGQPSDVGFLVPLLQGGKEGEKAAVRQVVRRNLDAVHTVDRPLEVGTKVRVEVEWERREDLMLQHSGQHLLSAVLDHAPYSLDTLSWSLQPYPELNYLELPSTLSPSQLADVENRVNALIAEGREVRVKMELATEGSGVRLGEKVPENYRDAGEGKEGGERPPVQRTVFIDGLDENPCCGTHLPSLTPLRQLFLSPYTTSIRGTNSRIYFAFGPRALRYLSSAHSSAREAALAAGCAVPDLPSKVEGLVAATTEGKRREKRLREELAGYVARDVVDEAVKNEVGGTLVAAVLREEDATNALDFLTLVASETAGRLVEAEQAKGKKHLVLLACGATAGSPTAAAAGGAVFIFGSDDALVAAAGKAVGEALGKERVRGGGKGRWQGKVTGRWETGDELLLRKVVREVVEKA
ncbi:hypothetical protein JCM8097_005629 [Rhodosporidiobolus ruineniae]